MSQQIQITGGAKVRDLQDVIIGTSGVLSSVAFDVANGVPKLDSNGKILVSQLPNSVMEYKGTWDASTNTPTLANGTGNQGDVYLCNVAGTVNFGAGPIAFVVGDQVIYSGTIWQRASGATGTVTSVAITESGDSLNITGSPITTSGTINIGFNGTNLQYVNGAGNLTTFPTLTGFVPYTGATGDVTLGNFSITGNVSTFKNSYIDGSASNNGQLMIKQAVLGSTNYAGYTSFYSTGTNISLLSDAGSSNYKSAILSLSSLTNNTARTYTLPDASGTIALTSDIPVLTGYVPYTGATANVDLGVFDLTADLITGATGSFASNGGSDTFAINHSSGGGIALNITKGGAGEGLYINKTSGSGNAATIIGTLEATTLVKSGGTSSQFLKADGTVDSNTYALDSLVVKLAGTQTITGAKTFTAGNTNFVEGVFTGVSGTTAGALHLYQSSSPSFFGGPNYTDIWADTTNINFNIRYSSAALLKQPVLNFGSLTDNTTRTYTFPDLTGTIAMLEGTQTFTGAATFTGSATFNNTLGNSIILNYGAALVKGNTPSSTSGVWSNIYAAAGNNNLVIADNANISKLQFQAASTQTYTFPAATGTIVLGSGTVGAVAYFNANGSVVNGSSNHYWDNANNRLGIANSIPSYNLDVTGTGRFTGQLILGSTINNGTYTYTLPSATGTLALTSDLSGYLPLTGGTLTGALNGTSASFSSSITASDFISTSNVTGAALRLLGGGTSVIYQKWSNGGGNYYIGISNSGGGGLLGSQNNYSFCLVTESARDMSFGTNSLSRMTIYAGGNVGINTGSTDAGYQLDVNGTGRFTGLITSTVGNGGTLLKSTNATTSYQVGVDLRNTGGVAQFGIESSVGGTFVNGSTAYASIFGSGNATAAEIQTNGTVRLSIASTGAATFSSSVTSTIANGYFLSAISATTSEIYARIGNNLSFFSIGCESSTGGTIVGGSSAYAAVLSQYQNNPLQLATNNLVRLTISGTGNVGIGTSSPSDRLNVVVGANGNNTRLDGPTSGLIFQTNASSVDIISYGGTTAAYREMNFATSASTNMTITTGGNVLIGTTTDSGQKLQVNGTIKNLATHTNKGVVSVPNNTPTTLYTFTTYGLYILYSDLINGGGVPTLYSAYAIIAFDGAVARIMQQTNGGGYTLTLTGNSIQATQTSGITQPCNYIFELIGA